MSNEKRKGWIEKDNAKKMVIVRDDRMVHTFLNLSFGLVGADHSYESIMKDIDEAKECNITGESAQKMGHGLAIIKKDTKYQSDILFVETKPKVRKTEEVRK